MRKLLLLIFTTILAINCSAQISFEKGYYITNANQKIECLIKNIDWKNSPTEFDYKLSENGEVKNIDINSVKEFGIHDVSKYNRATVMIDRSSDIVDKLSFDRKPSFNEEQLFLKVLVEGDANLYYYEDGNLRRFFYNKSDYSIEQLVYKRYKIGNAKIGKNNQYKQQISNNLKCSTIKTSRIENLKYEKNSLVKFFTDYNQYNNSDFVNYDEKTKRDLIKLTIRPRINSSSLSIHSTLFNSRDVDFDNEMGFGLGIEAEFIMPFNKNKWALILEPTYQYFNSEKDIPSFNVIVKYKSFELPIGLRHYLFLNDNSKIFINAAFVFDLSSSSYIEFDPGDNLDLNSRSNLALGLGYKHNEKLCLEIRYQTNRDLLKNYQYWYSEYNTLSFILGYSIF